MQVGVVWQLLTPGVQARQKAHVGPEMRGVLGDRQEGLGDRVQEERGEEPWSLEG